MKLDSRDSVYLGASFSLAFALGCLFAASGCADDTAVSTGPAPSRVNAVTAAPKKVVEVADFCDVHAAAAEAMAFHLPELAAAGPAVSGRWQWVNIWATWCKPCIEEFPLLAGWRDKLAADKVAVEQVFVSVDESAEIVSTFRESHPDVPASLRVRDVDALPAWLESLGLDESSGLPLHMFVDPGNKLRCVRLGGVSKDDYDVIKRVLTQS